MFEKALKCPLASRVLSLHLRKRRYPNWTSYFVKYKSVVNDQRGRSHFNWIVDDYNYHILRTGCWPYIKYHCTKRPHENLQSEDLFFRILKIINFGIPCLAYGIGAHFLIKHKESVCTEQGKVDIYFLYKENPDSLFWIIQGNPEKNWTFWTFNDLQYLSKGTKSLWAYCC